MHPIPRRLLALLLLVSLLPHPRAETTSTEPPATPETNTNSEDKPTPASHVWPAFASPDYLATTELPVLDESSLRATLHVAAPPPGTTPATNPAPDGSAERPFATILAARSALHAHLRAGTPVRLLISPGLYREDLRTLLNFKPEDGSTVRDTLLVIEGSAPGAVVISGSVEQIPGHDFSLPHWQTIPDRPGLYVHEWPFPGHLDPGPWMDSYGHALLPGLMQRSEMLWINGTPLRQILVEQYRWHDPDGRRGYTDRGTGLGGDPNNQPGKLIFDRVLAPDLETLDRLIAPGTFAVFTDPASPAELRGKVFLRLPPEHSAPNVRRIEVGLWKGRPWAPLLNVRAKNNVVLRNLAFTHATTGPMSPAVNLDGVRNFLIEDCSFSHNVAHGLNINRSSSGILRRVVASYNGANGIGLGEGSRQILMEDCVTAFNNVRGAWSAWIAWHASASKHGGVSNLTFRRHVSIGNYANGLWFDVYCRDILVENSLFLGNLRMGVMFELTRPRGGPHVLRDSVVAFNDNAGVYLSMAANSAVTGSLLVANGGGPGNIEGETHNTQLLFKVTPHPQGPKSAADWQSIVLRDNTLVAAREDSTIIDLLQRKANPLVQFPWVLAVLQADANRYHAPLQNVFRHPDGSYVSLDGWRALLSEHAAPGPRETSSLWTDDSGLDSDPRREFTPASTSPITTRARALGVPLPADLIAEYWSRVAAGLYAPPHLALGVNID